MSTWARVRREHGFAQRLPSLAAWPAGKLSLRSAEHCVPVQSLQNRVRSAMSATLALLSSTRNIGTQQQSVTQMPRPQAQSQVSQIQRRNSCCSAQQLRFSVTGWDSQLAGESLQQLCVCR